MAKNDRRFTLSTKEKNPSPSKAWSRLGAGSGAHRTWKDAPHGPPQAEQSAAQAALRLRAEVLAREDCDPPGYLETLSREEAEHMLHELRVYQIELEMQNEELRRAHEEMALLRSRYFDLYDLAPVGYFSLDETGLAADSLRRAAESRSQPPYCGDGRATHAAGPPCGCAGSAATNGRGRIPGARWSAVHPAEPSAHQCRR